jgi:hypothetical protein
MSYQFKPGLKIRFHQIGIIDRHQFIIAAAKSRGIIERPMNNEQDKDNNS